MGQLTRWLQDNGIGRGEMLSGGKALAVKVAAVSFQFFISIVVSRLFGKDGEGRFSLAISIITLLLLLSKSGYEIALMKNVSLAYQKGHGGDISSMLQSALLWAGGVSAAGTAVVLLLSSWLANVVFDAPGFAVLLRAMIFAVLPSALCHLLAAAFKGTKHVAEGLFYESGLVPMCSLAGILAALVLIQGADIHTAGIAYAIAAYPAAAVVACRWYVRKKKIPHIRSDAYSFLPIRRMAYSLLIVNATNYILSSMDTLMLGYWKTEAEVGLYAVAVKVTMVSSMLLTTVNALLGPRIAVLYAQGKREELERTVQRATRMMSAAALLLCVVLALLSGWILSLWGEAFIAARPVMLVSLIGQMVALGTGPLATVLMMCGREKIHRNATLFCAALNFVLNALLILPYGMMGAIVATTISLAAKNIYGVIAVKRYLGIEAYGRR